MSSKMGPFARRVADRGATGLLDESDGETMAGLRRPWVATPKSGSPRGLHRAAGALVALLLLSAAHRASAASVSSLIDWEAPEGCAGALEVYGRLSQLLGYEPEALGKLSRVRGSVVKTPGGYRLVLEAFERERRSSRLFESARCDDLVDAAALALALAMASEPMAASRSPSQASSVTSTESASHWPDAGAAERSSASSASALAATGADVTPPSTTDADEASPARAFALVEGLIEYGALPRLTPGIAVGAGIDTGALSIGVQGALFAAQTTRVAPGQSVEFELLAAGVRGCLTLHAAPPRVNACAALEAGRYRALGLDLAQASQARDLWLAAGAGLEARWPLSDSLDVQLRAEPVRPLRRKQYTVNGSDDVHTPDALELRLFLGLVLTGG